MVSIRIRFVQFLDMPNKGGMYRVRFSIAVVQMHLQEARQSRAHDHQNAFDKTALCLHFARSPTHNRTRYILTPKPSRTSLNKNPLSFRKTDYKEEIRSSNF